MIAWNEPGVQGRLQNIFSSIFRPGSRRAAGSDDNRAASPPSNAAASQSHRAQIPRPPPPRRRYLTRNVKDYIQVHDSVPCDPIEIDSDEDGRNPPDDQNSRSSRRLQTQRSHATHTNIGVKRSESRDEARLLPTLTKREPGSVTIPDPMKRPFAMKSGYKPMNTLDSTHPGTRSHHVFEKTTNIRNHSHDNNETHASKKRKLDRNHSIASGTTTAITLGDSQDQDESADELRLSPEPATGKAAKQDRHRRSSPGLYSSVHRSSRLGNIVGHPVSQDTRSSPEDEGEFTRSSARHRKAHKDTILASSSPVTSSTIPAGATSSPYFGAASTPFRPPRLKALQDGSPDVLQTDHSHQSGQSGNSLGEVDIKTLGDVIIGKLHTTATTRLGKSRTTRAEKSVKLFSLDEIVYWKLPYANIYVVEVDCDKRTISINTEGGILGDEPVVEPRPISKIVEVKGAHDDSPFVSLTFSRQAQHEEKMYLKFQSLKGVYDFEMLLQACSPTLKMVYKPADWMDAAFTRAKNECASHNPQRQHTATTSKDETHSVPAARAHSGNLREEKHSRHVDHLDLPHPVPRPPTIISGAERNAPAATNVRMRHIREQDLPGKAHEQAPQPRRMTRSQDHQQISIEDAHEEADPRSGPSKQGALGEPWRNDLVYPGPGKKSATVPFEDLRRLDDDEFLNDNLISFFMQYLETYMEKKDAELYREMYFFNTYFYEALTKNVKGKKGINYDAVSRWTKNINIFKRKFVIVPVNENFHWYLAIICNLSYFLPKTEDDGEGEEQADPNLQILEDSPSGDQPGEELENAATPATEDTQKSLAELSISDDEGNNSQNKVKDRVKKGPGRRKAVRRSLPKYDIDKPVIITLDSLGSPRSATCSLLRQYIAAEAKNKQDLEIDAAELRGMTAKQIPTQSNFSDCGLYLCMYLEQFVADPLHFVSRILQRQEEAQRWPQRIRSEDLRSRLRELILELHRRQESHKSTIELPDVGSIMIEKRKLSPEMPETLEPVKKRTKQEVAEARRRFDEIANARHDAQEQECSPPPQEQVSTSGSRHIATTACEEPASTARTFEDSIDEEDEPIIISREDIPRHQGLGLVKNDTRLQCHDETGAEVLITRSPPPDDGFAHSTPAELALNLRQQNELREAKRKRSRSCYESDSAQRMRARSASTEFLSGLESYAVHVPSPQGESTVDTDFMKLRSSPGTKGALRGEASGPDNGQYGWRGTWKRNQPWISPLDGAGQAQWTSSDPEAEVPETQDSYRSSTVSVRERDRDTDENDEMLLR